MAFLISLDRHRGTIIEIHTYTEMFIFLIKTKDLWYTPTEHLNLSNRHDNFICLKYNFKIYI